MVAVVICSSYIMGKAAYASENIAAIKTTKTEKYR